MKLKHWFAAAALVFVSGLGTRAHATYAAGCTVTLNVAGAIAHEARAVAIQADGKIVVAGWADLGLGKLRDFFVARLHPNLTLDTSFNGTGYLVEDLQLRDDEIFAVAISTDQKIVVGGYSRWNPSKVYMAFVRYNRDGSRDAGFGGGGVRLLDVTGSADDRIFGIAIQPDGKVVGVGYGMPTGNRQVALVRLLKNGNLDTSFDLDGLSLPPIAGTGFSFATGVRVQPDGKIVVSGEGRFVTSDFLAVRLRPDGNLDPTFNTNGWAATDIGAGTLDSASSLVLQPDGKIALAGTSAGNPVVVRYNTNGTLDTTFGGTGRSVHDFGGPDSGNAVALDASTNLIVAGDTNTPPYNFAFSRFRPNGIVDLTKIDDVSGMDDRAYAIAVTRAGKFLVAGSSQGPASLKATVALYLPDGNQDCGPPVYPVDVFTASSSGDAVNGQVTLNWLNPSFGPYDRTVIRRDTAGCPANELAGVSVTSQTDGVGAPGSFVDVVPLGPTYYYAAFVLDATLQASTGVCRTAKPFDRAVGKIEWSYGTAIAALTTPGLRLNVPLSQSVAYSVSNDGVVHAIRGGPVTSGGGSWPAGYRPFRTFSPAPSRPPVVPLPPTATLAVMIGSQDGHVYAVDAVTGALIWKSPNLGTTIVAAPAVVLSAWGGGADLVFIGTREFGQPNRFYALNATDGTVQWKFDNGGGAAGIGMIVGNATVDYTGKRVYFTSALGSSGKNTWCLNYLNTPPTDCWTMAGVTPLGTGDIEASPILYQGFLYVSDTLTGDLYAVNPADGTAAIFANLGPGGAKGFVFPHFGTSNLLASTSASTLSVALGSVNWVESCATNPTNPLFVPNTDWVFIGGNSGTLVQLGAAGGSCLASACIGNCVSTIVGGPTYDILKTMLYVGTDDGLVHGVRPPF